MLGSALATEISYQEGFPVVSAVGEVDLGTAPLLRSVLDRLMADGSVKILVDLESVEYLDASGLNVLIGALRRARELGGTIALINPAPPVLRILRLLDLTEVFPIYASVAVALVSREFGMREAPDAELPVRQLEITIASRPELVGKVRQAIERIGRRDGLNPILLEDIKLALSEACANAITHGSPLGARNTVNIRYLRQDGHVELEVKDQGHGFVLEEHPNVSPDGFEEGRRGLYIIRELMDVVEYFANGQGGTLRMIRRMDSHL